jgi:uncharacterized protein (DUF2235 family)
MKRLIVCADGTWNRADREGAAGATNVRKIFDAIAPEGRAGVKQVPVYHGGVGTSGSKLSRLIQGATGLGLDDNIKFFYSWLVDTYEPGDELFFFGFSRGAFTVRSLAGLIRNCGILRKTPAMLDAAHGTAVQRDWVNRAYDLYRDKAPEKAPDGVVARAFRATNSHPEFKIKCIGVWDTVGSLGIPTQGPIGWWTRRQYGFHDVRLSSWVENAFHALAIDELRKPFEATLWGVRESDMGKHAGQTVEQVWFPGVHSNVGGGYSDTSLSNLPFLWIAKRACDVGLVLKPGLSTQIQGDSLGKMYDSMTLFYQVFGVFQRPILQGAVDESTREPLHTFQYVSPYAFDRRRRYVGPDPAPPYDPPNLRHIAAAQEIGVIANGW